MTFRGDEHPDELISASLSGELDPAERAQLDAHLAACERCRGTLEAFGHERRMLGAMRRIAPPSDLGARVRAGIESGRGVIPWWRRPSTLVGTVATLATVAAALLAVVVLGSIPRGPIGATGSPLASPSVAASAEPSASMAIASQAPAASADATIAPIPSADPNPVGVMEYRLQDQHGSVAVRIDAATQPVEVQRLGTPVNSTLAPGADWVAFQILGEGSGLVDTYAYRVSDDRLVTLFTGAADSPFSRLAWSPDGSLLAFTGLSADGQSADAWVFSTLDPESGAHRLTDTGRSFAADFHGMGDAGPWLWVSTAAEGQPSTDRVEVPLDASLDGPVDPGSASLAHLDGVFLPVVGHGASELPMAVAWRGQMALDAGGWHFARGGMLYAYAANAGGDFDFAGTSQAVFDTVSITNGGEAFRGARFAWAPDGDGLAVWDAQWQGVPQPEGFPDETRVYFCHPLDGTYIGPAQALDAADTEGGTVIDVSLAGGQYLAVTVQTGAGSEAGTYGPSAEVRIITRNTGSVPDEVRVLADDGAWIGPAFYHHSLTAN